MLIDIQEYMGSYAPNDNGIYTIILNWLIVFKKEYMYNIIIYNI